MPRTSLSFVVYALILVTFVLVYLYTRTDNRLYVFGGVATLVACFIAQAYELSQGERVARSRIRSTKSDAEAFRKKGWL